MRHTRYTRILRVPQNGCPHLLRPTQPFQFAHADKRMLFLCGVPLVVEVVEQASGGVELQKRSALVTSKSAAIGLSFATSSHADFNRQGVLPKALVLGPLDHQLPGFFAPVSRIAACASAHFFTSCCAPWFAFLRGFQ